MTINYYFFIKIIRYNLFNIFNIRQFELLNIKLYKNNIPYSLMKNIFAGEEYGRKIRIC